MEKDKLVELAEEAIIEYFEDIDGTVDKIVASIIDKNGLDDDSLNEEDKTFLKNRIMRGVLKWDQEDTKPRKEDV
jgi:hypothetical protein